MKLKLPIFIENSRVPAILSRFAPIEIGAINIVFLVFSREELDTVVKRHETIHYRQWLELLVVGFAILYPLFWLLLKIKFRKGDKAYRMNPFEMEAYSYQHEEDYLKGRPWFNWRKFLWTISADE